jgi:hypothetical protein
MTYCFDTNPQIDECFIIPEFWTDEMIEEYVLTEAESYRYDEDQALEQYSLECAFGPEEY